VGHEIVEEEHSERSLLESSSFVLRGERLNDDQPEKLVVESLNDERAATLPE